MIPDEPDGEPSLNPVSLDTTEGAPLGPPEIAEGVPDKTKASPSGARTMEPMCESRVDLLDFLDRDVPDTDPPALSFGAASSGKEPALVSPFLELFCPSSPPATVRVLPHEKSSIFVNA